MREAPDSSRELRRRFGVALATRMGWSERAAEDLADHVVFEEGNGVVHFELRWSDQRIVAGILTDRADTAGLADGFAEAVEADLKIRIHRFGEQLPWS